MYILGIHTRNTLVFCSIQPVDQQARRCNWFSSCMEYPESFSFSRQTHDPFIHKSTPSTEYSVEPTLYGVYTEYSLHVVQSGNFYASLVCAIAIPNPLQSTTVSVQFSCSTVLPLQPRSTPRLQVQHGVIACILCTRDFARQLGDDTRLAGYTAM